jgi:hypothetical protein
MRFSACFYRPMAMSDEQQLERLEEKVDEGLTETRTEFRAIRAEIGGITRNIHAMWLTMILGFAALFVQNHL